MNKLMSTLFACLMIGHSTAVLGAAKDRHLLSPSELKIVEQIERSSLLTFDSAFLGAGMQSYYFTDATGRSSNTSNLEKFATEIESTQKRNIVIITDMEPDDRVALEIATSRMKDRIAFVGTTVMNARRKARLAEDQLYKSGNAEIPVFAGTGGKSQDYPDISSSRAAREYNQEGHGILSDKQLATYAEATFQRSSSELQTKLESILTRALDSDTKVEFMMLAPPTDLIAVLRSNPGLKAGIGHIHIMGGWVDAPLANSQGFERRTTYNWNMDPVSSAQLLSMTDIPMTLYSSHIIKPTFGGGSINKGNAPEAISVLEGSSAPSLQTFRTAGESWDNHLMEKIPPLKNVIGENAGKQFTPADPLIVIGMLNKSLVTSTLPVSVGIDVNNLDPARGYLVNVRENVHSQIRLVTGIDSSVFNTELVRSLNLIDRKSQQHTRSRPQSERQTDKFSTKFDSAAPSCRHLFGT